MRSIDFIHNRRRTASVSGGRARAVLLVLAATVVCAALPESATADSETPMVGLRAVSKPPTKPTLPAGFRSPRRLSRIGRAAVRGVAAPSQAVTWGQRTTSVSGATPATTLVLYDTTNTYGWLGELNAIGAGNLATHFGTVTAEPVVNYVPGQLNNYTATIYIGSTYNEPLPTAFLNDVISTTHPVIWAGDNVWQLAGAEGGSADRAFIAKYGWDAANSFFDTTDNPVTITYKGQNYSRDPLNGGDVLAPDIVRPSAVNVLATANCTGSTGAPDACAPIAQTTGTSFPWAIRSSNLTYVGEDPFSYMSESDRYVAFSDLLYAALAPAASASHLALVRLEDVSPASDPAELRSIANYLSSQEVPFSVNVIPEYTDPKGFYNNGVPQTITLAQAPAVVAALKYMESKGGTLNEEGFSHQYSNIDNPYTGTSGDDAEFFRAQCSSTQNPPYVIQDPCPNNDWVVWTGPVPGDSPLWAFGRVISGWTSFLRAGLKPPTVWVTPHYFASPADYSAIDTVFKTRYERDVFFGGQLTGGAINYSHIFGQFFPYTVHDLYGDKIIPENLGDYEPTVQNNHPARLPADIIHNAQLNLGVTQSVASFFFNPDDFNTTDGNNRADPLEQTVSGIKALGYTFVSPTSLP